MIYPNPSVQQDIGWTISGILPQDFNHILDLKVVNIAGQIIWRDRVKGKQHIRLTKQTILPAGIYLIQIQSENGFYLGKLVIQ